MSDKCNFLADAVYMCSLLYAIENEKFF